MAENGNGTITKDRVIYGLIIILLSTGGNYALLSGKGQPAELPTRAQEITAQIQSWDIAGRNRAEYESLLQRMTAVEIEILNIKTELNRVRDRKD